MRHCRLRLCPALLLLCAATAAAAQDQQLRFDVASIKPVDPNAFHMTGVRVFPGRRVVLSGLPLRTLVATAFHMSSWQIAGGDGWTTQDMYDIEAKPPESLQPGIRDLRHTLFGIEDESLRAMLQALLIDRFHLQFHRASKAGDVYALERNGKVLRLRAGEVPVWAADRSFGSIG